MLARFEPTTFCISAIESRTQFSIVVLAFADVIVVTVNIEIRKKNKLSYLEIFVFLRL